MPEPKVKNIYQRLAEIKAELSRKEIKKSGHNKYGGYHYHELGDFLHHIAELNKKHGVDDTFEIKNEGQSAVLTLTNVDEPKDKKIIAIPFVEAEMLGKGGAKSTTDAIQRMGATLTYNRRYLYMIAYDIAENDMVDKEQPEDTRGQQMFEKSEKTKARIEKHLDDNVSLLEDKKEILKRLMVGYDIKSWKKADLSKVNVGEFIDELDKQIKLQSQMKETEEGVQI